MGGVYAANTLGAIVGALGVSLILIPWIGTQQIASACCCSHRRSARWCVLLPYVTRDAAPWRWPPPWPASLVVAVLLAATRRPDSRRADRLRTPHAHVRRPRPKILYTAEGRNSSVAITRWADGATEDRRQRPRGSHHRALRHEAAAHGGPPAGAAASAIRKSVLGIGFGAGVSAGTFTRYPGIEKITVCEIEPVIPPTSTRYFARQDYDVLHNPRTRIVFDDARHYLLTTTDKFDIIASDPLDVFVKGTAALYSKEYFEAVKRHLNPGGMFTPVRPAL